MAATMDAELRLGTPVEAVTRGPEGATVRAAGASDRFDHVIMACHSDQSLRVLGDGDPLESRVLSRVRYPENRAVLHTDPAQMPRRRACWASWVYSASSRVPEARPSVTYWMNSLQKLPEETPLFVTLNPASEIPEHRILDEHVCHHPQFDLEALAAQAELPAIQGRRGTWFAGAWTGHGFHEDGLSSAVGIAERLGTSPPWQS